MDKYYTFMFRKKRLLNISFYSDFGLNNKFGTENMIFFLIKGLLFCSIKKIFDLQFPNEQLRNCFC